MYFKWQFLADGVSKGALPPKYFTAVPIQALSKIGI